MGLNIERPTSTPTADCTLSALAPTGTGLKTERSYHYFHHPPTSPTAGGQAQAQDSSPTQSDTSLSDPPPPAPANQAGEQCNDSTSDCSGAGGDGCGCGQCRGNASSYNGGGGGAGGRGEEGATAAGAGAAGSNSSDALLGTFDWRINTALSNLTSDLVRGEGGRVQVQAVVCFTVLGAVGARRAKRLVCSASDWCVLLCQDSYPCGLLCLVGWRLLGRPFYSP